MRPRLPLPLSLALLATTASPAFAAPERVKDIAGGSSSSIAGGDAWATAIGDTLLFAANDGINGVELWRSDGTSQGTYLLRDIAAGDASSNPGGPDKAHRFAPLLDGSVLLHASNGQLNGGAVWKSNGTVDGTVLVSNAAAGFGYGARFGTDILFAGTQSGDRNLWKTNGTGTTLVKSFYGVRGIVQLSAGVALLNASDGTGFRLYRTNGEGLGTIQLNSTPNVMLESGPAAILNGAALYIGNGYLWRSDGTTDGTQQLGNVIVALPQDGEVFVQANGLVFFNGNGTGLWKSDGTSAGTQVLKANQPLAMAAVGNTLYFAIEPVTKTELWKSDGTTTGTVRVKGGFRTIRQLTAFNGALYFSADDGISGEELWTSDGTADGTKLMADIAPGAGSSPAMLRAVGSALFFSADDGSSGRELWALRLPVPDAGTPQPDAGPSATDAGGPDASSPNAAVEAGAAEDATPGAQSAGAGNPLAGGEDAQTPNPNPAALDAVTGRDASVGAETNGSASLPDSPLSEESEQADPSAEDRPSDDVAKARRNGGCGVSRGAAHGGSTLLLGIFGALALGLRRTRKRALGAQSLHSRGAKLRAPTEGGEP